MGILSRISKILESNLTALVDRAEDPGKMLDQAIEDMKKGRADAHRALIEAKTQKRLLEKKAQRSREDAAEFERKAMVALRASDEPLARKLLELKASADQRLASEAAAVAEQEAQIAELENVQQELERRLTEMPARRAALLARQAAAQAKGARAGASGKSHDSVASALEAFERMEEKVVRAEVEAEVITEANPRLLDAGAMKRYDTDEALAALKAKIAGQLPSGAKAPEPEPELLEAENDPVEDSLREMKAKLRREGGK